ncbi:MAG: hypothetical protein OMM_09582 [Candidatus Magnetoglobus multicellularis str. Araruama]|uniref:Uncharacterized protein n=1 Tax=Candidatus Magnetoglobus multicellularis str. Araruama TaxID=890399 RepID=A0A1V1P3S4_9BACT|nr:MAG: hypothetical protein OMM_09582 [Candidatus Magnetoglobus multicellularis str. Araruama]
MAVDDLDLLYVKPDGDEEVKRLINYLNQLASESFFNVLATVRSEAFDKREKDIIPFRKIGNLDNESIQEIYQKHIELFNNKQPIFTDDALKYLLNCSDNCIGSFLKSCHSIFTDNYGWYARKGYIDKTVVKKQIEKEIKEHVNYRETSTQMIDIINTIQKQRTMEYTSEDSVPDVFLDRMLEKDSRNPDKYYLNKLYRDVIIEFNKNGD